MRRSLPVFLTALFVVGALVIAGAPAPARATIPDTVLSTEEPTTTTTTIASATRGTPVQLVTTLPAPTTTTTTTTAPPKPNPYAVPANTGTGRRVVYSKSRMRLWLVEADGSVTRTYLVSGRLNQPALGTHKVFSRSTYTCNIDHPNVCMRWMVRFAKGLQGDNIGFHEIPRKDGVPIQSDSQLGQALSSGCVRQSTADAMFMWGWAGIGTTVVVIW